jgi:hypothetical protein
MPRTGKIHPLEKDEAQIVELSQKIRDWAEELVDKVHKDIEDRRDLEAQWAEDYDRRYQRMFRNTNFPWPDASDIVMPLIDSKIDQMKPVYANLIGAVDFKPMNETAFENAVTADMTYQWLLNQKMKDYTANMLYVLDDMLTYGWGIAKSSHRYETTYVKRTIKFNDLPQRIKSFTARFEVVGSEAEKQVRIEELAQLDEQELLSQPFPVLQSELNQALEGEIRAEFGLDPEEKEDKEALKKIMKMLNDTKGEVDVKYLEETINEPYISAVPTYDFVVPFHTRGIQDADRCTHRMFMSKERLNEVGRNHMWNKEAVENVMENEQSDRRSSLENDVEQRKRFREGIGDLTHGSNTDNIEVWEIYAKFYHDDGKVERLVVTCQPNQKEFFRIRQLPFAHGKWPFVQFPFEPNDERFHSSRGIPRKLDDVDKEITVQHRAKLNRMLIANAPTFMYRMGGKINPNTIHWTPGEFIPVLNMNDLQAVQIPNLDISFEREENILRTWADAHLGTFDSAITDQNNLSEARSATEVNAIQQQARNALTVRGTIFQQRIKELHGMNWDVWIHRGPREFEAIISGREPKIYTRKEIQGDFDIVPVGSIGEYSKANEADKARTRFLFSLQVPDEVLGIQWELNRGALYHDWLSKEDEKTSRIALRQRSPEEIQQIQEQLEDQAEAEQETQGIQAGLQAGVQAGR